ncbi:hypothetical protein Daus18300_014152, partial [Diaporthe australafricana]
MALATSPCLYSVKVACSWRDSDGDDDFNHEAMMEPVASLAPNLKEVVIEHVLQIQSQYPALQELAISVKRTKSDALEADIYRSFSKIERLKSLFLTLDYSDWRVTRDPDSRNDPSFDEIDRENHKVLGFLKKGHLREILMNCAVDETLARSNWETICQYKVGQQLESLKLWTTKGGQWGSSRTDGDTPDLVKN